MSNDYVDNGVPVIRGQNMGGRWVSGDFVFVTREKARSLSANLARPNDIVFTQRGTLGQVSLVPFAPYDEYLVSQSQMKLTVNPEIADPLFIYYVFSSPRQHEYVHQNAIQTGVPHTNLGILRETPIPHPPLREQRSIADVLGALDDKIELNRRMNQTLEAIARAIFKSWFVEFEPVRARMEGRQPSGMNEVAAKAFPSRLVESQVGLVPEGWEVTTLGDISDVVRGRSYRSSELDESSTALVTLKSFHRGGGYRTDGLKPFIGPFSPEQRVHPGEVILACTDVTQAAEVVGRPAIVLPNSRFHTLVASLDVAVIRPTVDGMDSPFLFFLLESEDFHAHAYAHTTGTTVLHLDRNCIPRFPIVRPNRQVLSSFSTLVSPLFQRIVLNVEETLTLSNLRDALIPKLISGELRVGLDERAEQLETA